MPGTDILRSFCAVGREFAFPIDYSKDKHLQLTSTPADVTSYSKTLAKQLEAGTELAKILIEENRASHRELINARRPHPKIYAVGDTVFARRAVRSVASRGLVDKLQFAYTGPWRVTKVLDGASYELQHVRHPTKTDKKHASDLSPYPTELIAFEPLDGADNRYGQLYKPISAKRFDEAGLKGFLPSNPFQLQDTPATTHYLMTSPRFRWPSLSELNDELDRDFWGSDPDAKLSSKAEPVSDIVPAFSTETAFAGLQQLPDVSPGPPPAAPGTSIPTIPSIDALTATLVLSTDRLYFVSISVGLNDVREWRLVRLDFESSVRQSPACMQTGKFLCEFYIGHPADCRFNAVNQRFWLQYFKESDLLHQDESHEAHLVRPSSSSAAFAARNNLVTARKFIHLLHEDTFIHGPFDFATVHNRKTRDRIGQADWQVLADFSHMFQNPIPSFLLPTYSIHVDNGIHYSFLHNHNMQFLTHTSCDGHNSDEDSLFSDYVPTGNAELPLHDSDDGSLFSDVES